MPMTSQSLVPDFMPWALAVANVGTWRCSMAERHARCDSVMAEMFGLTEAEAHQGVPFDRIREIIHPADRFIFDRKNEECAARGGYLVMEYRIVPRPGIVRRMLIRGHYEPPGGLAGGETGHGIAIDITATDGPFQAVSAYRPIEGDTVLHRAADMAIALHREITELGPDTIDLRAAADLVLSLIGRRLAQDVPRDALD